MSVEFITLKCPECGAMLSIEESRERAFCTYCGAKVLIHNQNEHIIRHIDEAEVTQAKTERLVQMRKMELKEKKRIDDLKTRMRFFKASAISTVMGIILVIVGLSIGNLRGFTTGGLFLILMSILSLSILDGAGADTKKEDSGDIVEKVRIPKKLSEFESMDYTTVEGILTGSGFTQVKSVALKDLSMGILTKPGTVESITIDGHKIKSGGGSYPIDAPVIITYHSLKK